MSVETTVLHSDWFYFRVISLICSMTTYCVMDKYGSGRLAWQFSSTLTLRRNNIYFKVFLPFFNSDSLILIILINSLTANSALSFKGQAENKMWTLICSTSLLLWFTIIFLFHGGLSCRPCFHHTSKHIVFPVPVDLETQTDLCLGQRRRGNTEGRPQLTTPRSQCQRGHSRAAAKHDTLK